MKAALQKEQLRFQKPFAGRFEKGMAELSEIVAFDKGGVLSLPHFSGIKWHQESALTWQVQLLNDKEAENGSNTLIEASFGLDLAADMQCVVAFLELFFAFT
ncbi:unnamed protein product, partial [Symbiodinium sp. KB8]